MELQDVEIRYIKSIDKSMIMYSESYNFYIIWIPEGFPTKLL